MSPSSLSAEIETVHPVLGNSRQSMVFRLMEASQICRGVRTPVHLPFPPPRRPDIRRTVGFKHCPEHRRTHIVQCSIFRRCSPLAPECCMRNLSDTLARLKRLRPMLAASTPAKSRLQPFTRFGSNPG